MDGGVEISADTALQCLTYVTEMSPGVAAISTMPVNLLQLEESGQVEVASLKQKLRPRRTGRLPRLRTLMELTLKKEPDPSISKYKPHRPLEHLMTILEGA